MVCRGMRSIGRATLEEKIRQGHVLNQGTIRAVPCLLYSNIRNQHTLATWLPENKSDDRES